MMKSGRISAVPRIALAALAAVLATSAHAQLVAGAMIPTSSGSSGGGVAVGTSGATVPLNNGANVETGLWTFTKNLYLPITLSPSSTAGSGSRGIYANETMTGACAGGCAYNMMSIGSDAIPVGGNAVGWGFNMNAGGSTMKGNRATGNFTFLLTSPSGNTGGQSYSGLAVGASSGVNDGGTDTTNANSRGQIEALNVIGTLNGGATNFNSLQSVEFDVHALPGSSVSTKEGVAIVQLVSDQVAGAVVDSAIVISNGPPVTQGIGGGSYAGGAATLTIAGTSFTTGATVTIAGAAPSCLNGKAALTAQTGTTATVPTTCSGSGSISAAGTATQSAVGWTQGILFGGYQGVWPLQSTATAIGCSFHCGELTNVLDFSGATIDGYFLHGPGFTVDGAGNVAAGGINARALVQLAAYATSGTALPACNSAIAGSLAYVTDGAASPTWNGGYVAGAGSGKDLVFCDGSNWTYH